MGKGRRYELQLANSLDDETVDDVAVAPWSYSGNDAKVGAPDLVVISPNPQFQKVADVYYIELKKRTAKRGNRCSISDFESELERFIDNAPNYAETIVALRFNQTELALFEAASLLTEARERGDGIESDNPFKPRTTDSGGVSFVKPETSEWNTIQSGSDDTDVLIDALGLEKKNE